MKNLIHITGRINFHVPNLTKKHSDQSQWKRVAVIDILGEHSEYYAWFIKKRYSITLNKPIRGSHITFINDRFSNITGNNDGDKEILWEEVKNKYHKKIIPITLSVDVRSDSKHWWLNIPEEYRGDIHDIRNELGLGRPYFGLHMTIGEATHLQLEQSKYIHGLIEKKLIK